MWRWINCSKLLWMSKSLKQTPSLCIIIYIAQYGPLRHFCIAPDCLLLHGILQIQRRVPISYLGLTMYKTTMRKKNTLKRPHSLPSFSVPVFFFFLNGDTTQSTQVVQIVFLHQEQSSEQLWVAVSKFLAYFQREFNNRGITLLSNEYIKAGEQ